MWWVVCACCAWQAKFLQIGSHEKHSAKALLMIEHHTGHGGELLPSQEELLQCVQHLLACSRHFWGLREAPAGYGVEDPGPRERRSAGRAAQTRLLC